MVLPEVNILFLVLSLELEELGSLVGVGHEMRILDLRTGNERHGVESGDHLEGVFSFLKIEHRNSLLERVDATI